MDAVEANWLAEQVRLETLYAPIYAWCKLQFTPYDPDAPIDIDGEFYRALDKVVRHDDFIVDEVAKLIAAHFCSDLDDPGINDYFGELCWRAKAVREYLEARGEAKKRDARSGLLVH